MHGGHAGAVAAFGVGYDRHVARLPVDEGRSARHHGAADPGVCRIEAYCRGQAETLSARVAARRLLLTRAASVVGGRRAQTDIAGGRGSVAQA
jgi:hypothetical protein